MSSRVTSFDTTNFRLVGNGLPPALDTLEEIYAFGLGADPFNDNLFGMPAGNLRFPGLTSSGAHHQDAAVEWFQNRAAITFSSPPPFGLLSNAHNLTGAGGGGNAFFWEYELNDPSWNGTFHAINTASVEPQWITDVILYSADSTQGPNHNATEYGRGDWDAGGVGPSVFPNPGPAGASMLRRTFLYNDTEQLRRLVDQVSGYGQNDRLLEAIQPGASSQFVTHWLNNNLAPAAGDGPTWWVSTSASFGVFDPHAGIGFHQLGADPVTGGWGAAIYGHDGTNVVALLALTPTGGSIAGGKIATLDTGALSGVEVYESAVIDATVSTVGNVIVPARAGFIFVPTRLTCLTLAVGGAVTASGSTVIKSGGNTLGTFVQPFTGDFAKGCLTGAAISSASTAAAFQANQPLTADVTAATGTGGFAWQVVYSISGYWRALP